MSDLRPCVECRRHVSIAEHACPFCGAAREPAAAAGQRFKRVSRAAVFAGAALASTACGGKKPKTDTIDNQQGAMQADGGVPQTPPDNTDPNDPNNPNNIPMPYGAPPARRRVV
jgi:hypothetical protein